MGGEKVALELRSKRVTESSHSHFWGGRKIANRRQRVARRHVPLASSFAAAVIMGEDRSAAVQCFHLDDLH